MVTGEDSAVAAALAYAVRGEAWAPGRTTVVLIHGLGGSGADWEPQVAALEPERRCLLPDLRGHGASPRTNRRPRVADHAHDVLRLLDALGESGRVHLLGVSLGSMVALEIAASAPERVRSVAALSPVCDARIRSLRSLAFLLGRWIPLRLCGPRRIALALAPRLFPGEEMERLRADFVEAWSRNDPRSYRLCFEGSVGWTIHGRETDVRCPVLILRGGRDYCPEGVALKLTQALPNGRFHGIEGAGHALPVERPAETNAVLLPFLEEAEAAGGR